MKQENIFTKVERATVTVLKKGGQGVLVNSNLIITAAHCIDLNCEEGMALALGYYKIEEIKTSQGELLKVAPLAVEPISDIALLGSLDDQEFTEEAEAFKNFCEDTNPVPLYNSDFELFQEFRVHIYTHKGSWAKGIAMQCKEDAESLFLKADEQIEAGTSGSPIINDSGELVGIVSIFSFSDESEHKPEGPAPCPHLTIPVWAYRRILNQ